MLDVNKDFLSGGTFRVTVEGKCHLNIVFGYTTGMCTGSITFFSIIELPD